MFTLQIDTDNAAFTAGDPRDDAHARRHEVARILRQIAKAIETGADNGPARDANGNTVGTFALTADE